MPDVALADAQVIWGNEDISKAPPVKVVGGAIMDDNIYSSSWGACNQDFAEADDATKLTMLLTQSIYLTLVESIDPTFVHDAFMVIPEYRAALRSQGVIPPGDDEDY